MPQILPVISALIWCMSRYIRPVGTIRERYTNLLEGHKIECLVLVGESNIKLRRKGVEAPVYYFFHGDFPDIELFASHSYILVVGGGP